MTFDYIAPKDPAMYDLRFRVVRFRISGGCYETVYTNLDSETFPIGTIKELYRLRWGIETSFRELKYTIGPTRKTNQLFSCYTCMQTIPERENPTCSNI